MIVVLWFCEGWKNSKQTDSSFAKHYQHESQGGFYSVCEIANEDYRPAYTQHTPFREIYWPEFITIWKTRETKYWRIWNGLSGQYECSVSSIYFTLRKILIVIKLIEINKKKIIKNEKNKTKLTKPK